MVVKCRYIPHIPCELTLALGSFYLGLCRIGFFGGNEMVNWIYSLNPLRVCSLQSVSHGLGDWVKKDTKENEYCQEYMQKCTKS